jgi:hypothetical protein
MGFPPRWHKFIYAVLRMLDEYGKTMIASNDAVNFETLDIR